MNDRRFRWGIREKLTLLFFSVTLIAIAANFMLVIPRLELRLRSDTVKQTTQTANRFHGQVTSIFRERDPQLSSPPEGVWVGPLQYLHASTGMRVALLRPVHLATVVGPVDRFRVVYDPSGETQTAGSQTLDDPIALHAMETGRQASGVVNFGGGLNAETAMPLTDIITGERVGVVVYSSSLGGVTTTVRQVVRRQVFSGIIALSIALIAGLLASSWMARRLRRLEKAARAVADGNFTQPILIDADDEIGEVARAFNTMQSRLGRADHARKAFVANASHELRTPLFSLGGYVELMREEELDEETQREFLDQMHVQIRRMTKLATDLLDLSKIDAGSLTMQPQHIDLAALVRSLAGEFGPAAIQHGSAVTITAEDGSEAICDPDRVAQILRILVDNVFSHTPEGTAIELIVEHVEGGVALRVKDDGPGIPADQIGHVFDRFHTGDKTGGTGIGLSIARELASAMDGTLDVSSSAAGTTFTLTLPPGVRIAQRA